MRFLPLGVATLAFCSLAHSQASVPIACVHPNAPHELQDLSDVDMALDKLPARDYAELLRTCVRRPLRLLPNPKYPPLPPPVNKPAESPPAPVVLPVEPVASTWLEADRRMYSDLLAAKGADVLVVPMQTQAYGFDRTERSLMTAHVAYELGGKVADPFLVARALGEGRRRYNESEIMQLAARLKAKRVIVGYVGHLDRKNMNVTLQDWQLSKDFARVEQRQQRDWVAIPFTHEVMPHSAFRARLPQMLTQLGLRVNGTAAASLDERPSFPSEVPHPPRQLVSGQAKDVPASAALLLFAGLAPFDAERTRERMFERALIATVSLDGDHPRRRFTEAFALMQLGRRPAALKALKQDEQPAATTLRALVNGNLPEAKANLAEVRSPFERFLLRAVIADVADYYGRPEEVNAEDALRLFATAADAWLPLVAWRLTDLDEWQVPAALDIKQLLDETFRASGLEAASIVAGREIVNENGFDEVNIDVASARHLRRITQELAQSAASGRRLSALDLVWLLEASAESRLVKQFERMGYMQGLQREALALLEKYRPHFDGHPQLVDIELQNSQELARTAVNDEAASWKRRARAAASFSIQYWQGQSLSTWSAEGVADALDVSYAADVFAYDFPRRSYSSLRFMNNHLLLTDQASLMSSLIFESLAFNQYHSRSLLQLSMSMPPKDRAQFERLAEGRFNGSPERRGANAPAVAKITDPLAKLRAALQDDPNDWQGYFDLGTALVTQQGAYEEAAKIFLSYPGFKADVRTDAVSRSVDSHEAGSLLYWHGRPELAKPLYEFSASLDTGSAAEMASAIRLDLLRGDFAAAAHGALERVHRYPSAYAFRDYLSLLHTMDYSQDAWSSFAQVAGQFETNHAWISALVGHRKQGMDAAGIKAWLLKPEIRDAKFRSRQFALDYALMWGTTDFIPPDDLGQLIDSVGQQSAAKIDVDGRVIRPHPEGGGGMQSLRPTPLPGLKIKPLPPGTVVRSSRALFADAYVQLRRGNYSAAMEKFRAYAELYPVDGISSDGITLAYMAAASARTGDPLGLEKFLNESKWQREDFHGWLARAFFHSQRKENDAAETALKKAFRVRQIPDDSPILSEYQFAEACEWIYQQTGDARFKNMLLDWTKRHQLIQPTHAWAYAMQYTYETDAAARERALAMTLYLDPKSHRIAKAKAAEIAKARTWLEQSNPFKQASRREQTQARAW